MSDQVHNEKDLQRMIYNRLSHWFHVESEVWSSCHTRRIDLLAFHKSDISGGYPIGIEIKKFNKKTGADIAKWMQQAYEYSSLTWGSYGRAMIIVAPQMSGYVFAEGELTDKNHLVDGRPHPHHNFSTFLGQFGIGELQSYIWKDYRTNQDHKRLRIAFKGSVIWDEAYDRFNYETYDRVCVK